MSRSGRPPPPKTPKTPTGSRQRPRTYHDHDPASDPGLSPPKGPTHSARVGQGHGYDRRVEREPQRLHTRFEPMPARSPPARAASPKHVPLGAELRRPYAPTSTILDEGVTDPGVGPAPPYETPLGETEYAVYSSGDLPAYQSRQAEDPFEYSPSDVGVAIHGLQSGEVLICLSQPVLPEGVTVYTKAPAKAAYSAVEALIWRLRHLKIDDTIRQVLAELSQK